MHKKNKTDRVVCCVDHFFDKHVFKFKDNEKTFPEMVALRDTLTKRCFRESNEILSQTGC